MEIDKKTGIIGTLAAIILLLGGMSINEHFSAGELQHAYVCDVTQSFSIFEGGISGTGYSAYPYSENRSGFKRCVDLAGNRGEWIPYAEYVKLYGVPIAVDPVPYIEVLPPGEPGVCALQVCPVGLSCYDPRSGVLCS